MRYTTLTQSGVPGCVMAGPISHKSAEHILLILVGVELPLCVVVTLS